MNTASLIFDLAFLVVAGATAWFVARRLVVDSAILLLAIVLASLLSIVLFEPIAELCRKRLFSPTDVAVTKFLWSFFALGIFVLAFIILLQSFSVAVGKTPELGRLWETAGCWVIGGLAGYVLAAFLLTVVHILPGSRDFRGTFMPEVHRRIGPVMTIAPDYQFLAFVEYTCSPRSAFTGRPWQLGRPVVSAGIEEGHWASFPIRYAVWREDLESSAEAAKEKSADQDTSTEGDRRERIFPQ